MLQADPPPTRAAALRQALADHRAGQLASAEKAYRALLGEDARDVAANHHLGVLLVQSGRMEEGLSHLKSALETNPAEPLFYFSLAKGHLAAGNPAEAGAVLRQAMQRGVGDERFEPLKTQMRDAAVAQYRRMLALRPDDPAVLDNLGTALLEQGSTDQAIACYRRALMHDPDFPEAHFHLGAVLSQHGQVAEGFAHYMRRAALVHGGGLSPAENPPPFKRKHDQAQRAYLRGRNPEATAGVFELADGDRLSGPAVNPASPQLLEQWRTSSPQLVVIDDFLTEPALQKLRAYCAGSTVWKKIYEAGYLGAAPEDGFASPLLGQIVEEIQSVFAPILAGESFRYLGAFKYDSALAAGTNTHADNSKVNVNFYIAPDDANLDPESGGMQIWDAGAPDIRTMRRLNGSEELVQAFLKQTKAKRVTIPHRANRAVIFKSTQFHKSDSFRFEDDYLSQRINISLLFGRFGEGE